MRVHLLSACRVVDWCVGVTEFWQKVIMELVVLIALIADELQQRIKVKANIQESD